MCGTLVWSRSSIPMARRSVSETIWTSSPELDHRKTRIYSGPTPIEQYDRGRDGMLDSITTVILDENQRPVRRETDVADEAGVFDGVPDSFSEYSYGPHGLVEQKSYAAGQPPSLVVTYEYDAAGRHTVDRWDHEGDGVVDELEMATYDEQGRYATWTLEDLVEPELSQRWTYHYDCE